MNEIVKPGSAGLPTNFGDNLMKGIAETRSAVVLGDGKPFFKQLKNGSAFCYGLKDERVEVGSLWAVNLMTPTRGWVCWNEGKMLGQVMASIQQPWPAQPAPVQGKAFQEQFGFEITCVTGSDAGQLCLYRNNSHGFKKAYLKMMDEVYARYANDRQYYWPLVTFTSEAYDHPSYGETWNPIFTIVAWADAEGNLSPDTAHLVPDEDEPAPPPPKRQRKVATAAREPEPEPAQAAQPAPQAAQPTGQRRRPAAR